jgi:hypothetical protein
MIRIVCTFEASVCRSELDDYMRGLDLSVVGYTEDGQDVLLGRMSADLLLLQAASDDGEPLVAICDNDSGAMIDLYASLFNEDYTFLDELCVDDNTDHVLFLWQSVFHPKLRAFQSNILNTLPHMFGNDCAMVMRRTACDLEDRELVDLGFKKIAATEFLFRHLSYLNEYTKIYPRGMEIPVDFEVTDEDSDWVLDRWDEE